MRWQMRTISRGGRSTPSLPGSSENLGLRMTATNRPKIERLFFAAWPAPEIQEHLHALGVEALPAGAGDLVPRPNLHLTLLFLGAVEADKRPALEAAAAQIKASAFDLSIDKMEWQRRSGILWAAPTHMPEPLLKLVVSLKAAVAGCGLVLEARSYRAHVTLARKVSRARRSYAGAPFTWPVRDFCLVESRLGPNGSDYTVQRRWPLKDEG